MTAKEKAKDLVRQFYSIGAIECKKCALIAVNLRLEGDFIFTSIEYGEESLEYWELVKKEIEKL